MVVLIRVAAVSSWPGCGSPSSARAQSEGAPSGPLLGQHPVHVHICKASSAPKYLACFACPIATLLVFAHNAANLLADPELYLVVAVWTYYFPNFDILAPLGLGLLLNASFCSGLNAAARSPPASTMPLLLASSFSLASLRLFSASLVSVCSSFWFCSYSFWIGSLTGILDFCIYVSRFFIF